MTKVMCFLGSTRNNLKQRLWGSGWITSVLTDVKLSLSVNDKSIHGRRRKYWEKVLVMWLSAESACWLLGD